jgi:uncharacterized protein (UPF0332 family)
MNEAFKGCLKKVKIISFPRAKSFVRKELEAAEDDLTEAKDCLLNGRYKYAAINSYYAIFHAARALIYSKGYRERSHHCLSVALEALFVEKGKMSERFIRIFKNRMSLRENADNISSFSEESASLSVSNTKEFLEKVTALLR